MVTVAIIAILAAIAIPQYLSLSQKAQDTEVMLLVDYVEKEAVTFYALNDRYPTYSEMGWYAAALDPWQMHDEDFSPSALASLLFSEAHAGVLPPKETPTPAPKDTPVPKETPAPSKDKFSDASPITIKDSGFAVLKTPKGELVKLNLFAKVGDDVLDSDKAVTYLNDPELAPLITNWITVFSGIRTVCTLSISAEQVDKNCAPLEP